MRNSLFLTFTILFTTLTSFGQFKIYEHSNTKLCPGGSLLIKINGNFLDGDSVDSIKYAVCHWGDNSELTIVDTLIPFIYKDTLRIPSVDHYYKTSGKFSAFATIHHKNNPNTLNTDTIEVMVARKPTFDNVKAYEYGSTVEVEYLCSKDSIKISATIEIDEELNNRYYPYKWVGANLRQVDSTTAYVRPGYDKDETYTLYVKDDFDCPSYTTQLTLKTLEAKASADPTSVQAGENVQFTNDTEITDDVKWMFQSYNPNDTTDVDTDYTNTVNPNRKYTTSDTTRKFRAYMIAKKDMCTDTTEAIQINIIPSVIGKFPNSFVPDGENNIYKLEGEAKSIESFEAIIYTKLGQAIYDWSDPNEGWDGNIGSNPAPAGVYFYYFESKGYDGKTSEERGFFHLFR